MISNNCESFDSYSSMTTRVMLREFEECIDDVVMILNEFIGVHQSLEKFEDFRKWIYADPLEFHLLIVVTFQISKMIYSLQLNLSLPVSALVPPTPGPWSPSVQSNPHKRTTFPRRRRSTGTSISGPFKLFSLFINMFLINCELK